MKWAARVAGACDALERRVGPRVAAGLVAAVLLLLAALYVTPSPVAGNHGCHYQALSVAPFDFDAHNRLQNRVLTPLVAHCLGLRGRTYLLLPVVIGWILLALVHAHARRRGLAPGECAGVTALLAFSTPILASLHFTGYTDTTTYLAVFVTWIARSLPVATIAFAVAVANHESAMFAAPWLIAARALDCGSRRAYAFAACLGAALVPTAVYRAWLQSVMPGGLDTAYFLTLDNVQRSLGEIAKNAWLGVFMAFKLLWWFAFAGALACWRGGRRGRAAWFGLVCVCAAAQLVFATDTSRLLGLAFPAVLAGAYVMRDRDPAAFPRVLWTLLAYNLLVPQYYVGQDLALPLFPVPVTLGIWLSGRWPFDLWWG